MVARGKERIGNIVPKTNNMKLYTEEQVIRMMELARFTYNSEDKILFSFTPIELPSDEEIEKYDNHSANYDDFQLGAKWMKEQILNQNK